MAFWTPEWCQRMETLDMPSHLNYINSFVKSILGMSDEGVEIPSFQLFGNKRLVEVRVIRLMKFSLYLP